MLMSFIDERTCRLTLNRSHIAIRIVVAEVREESGRQLVDRAQTLKLIGTHLPKPCGICDGALDNYDLGTSKANKVYRLRWLCLTRLQRFLRELHDFDRCANGRCPGWYCKDGPYAAGNADPLKHGCDKHVGI